MWHFLLFQNKRLLFLKLLGGRPPPLAPPSVRHCVNIFQTCYILYLKIAFWYNNDQSQNLQCIHFSTNLDSLCCTSSSVGGGLLVMQIVGEISFGSLGLAACRAVTGSSKFVLRCNIFLSNGFTYLNSFLALTGCACQRLLLLLYWRLYNIFPVAEQTFGRKLWALWSIAASKFLPIKLGYLQTKAKRQSFNSIPKYNVVLFWQRLQLHDLLF